MPPLILQRSKSRLSTLCARERYAEHKLLLRELRILAEHFYHKTARRLFSGLLASYFKSYHKAHRSKRPANPKPGMSCSNNTCMNLYNWLYFSLSAPPLLNLFWIISSFSYYVNRVCVIYFIFQFFLSCQEQMSKNDMRTICMTSFATYIIICRKTMTDTLDT